MITLLCTDENLAVIGNPITCWTSVEAVLRFNEPSSGQFVAPGYPWLRDQVAAAHRIVLVRDGAIFCAGPIEQDVWEFDLESNPAPGTLTVTWADDLSWIAGRVTYPDPTADAETQTAAAQYVATGFAGTLMTELVNANAGPGALLARRVPALTIGAGAGIGASLTISSRFQPLADELRSLATRAGLGFRTVQSGTDIVFEVYQPQDLTGAVRFSVGLGNLRRLASTRTRPTVTAALIAGQGEGTARTIVEHLNAPAISTFGRLEAFVDQRHTNDAGELDQAGDEALTEGAETAQLATVTVDTAHQRYGAHYHLGDKVSVEDVADVVRSVRLDADEHGEVVTATVGSQEASPDPAWVRALRRMDRRLSLLQTATEA